MRLSLLFLTFTLLAQERTLQPPEQPNPKTLIPQSLIETIATEVSGSMAMNSIYDLAGYEHDRLADEYKTTYREAAYMEKMAKQFGLEDVHIERFKMPYKTWDAEVGELWVTSPVKKLIVSYRDIAASIAPGSQSGDVTAELVYVGRGDREGDYEQKNVAGKIVLASGPPAAVHNLAVRRYNALAVVSFANPTGRPIDRPDEISWNNLGGRGGNAGGKTTFAFNLSRRMGADLVEMLEREFPIDAGRFGEIAPDVLARIDSVLLLACGTSYYAGCVARYWIESIAQIPVNVEIASEYRYRKSVPNPNALVVVISQSGRNGRHPCRPQACRGLGNEADARGVQRGRARWCAKMRSPF